VELLLFAGRARLDLFFKNEFADLGQNVIFEVKTSDHAAGIDLPCVVIQVALVFTHKLVNEKVEIWTSLCVNTSATWITTHGRSIPAA
jgi:hypothetical protein